MTKTTRKTTWPGRILNKCLTALGVDPIQWRMLVRVSTKRDFRSPNYFMAQQNKNNYSPLAFLAVFLGIMSLFFCIILIVGHKNPYFPITFFLTYTTFAIGMTILMDFGSIVISPDDFQILAYQPVSSRTYLAVKIANVLFYVGILTVAAGLLPWFAIAFFRGINPPAFAVAALATLGCTFSTALVMILTYTSILRFVHPRKLQRALSYLQLLMSFAIFGGNIFIPTLMQKMDAIGCNRLLWMLYPVSWFSGAIELSLGIAGWMQIVSAILALASLIFLLRFVSGNLSMTYSERLAVLMDSSEEKKPLAPTAAKPRRRRLFFQKEEARAIALLIRNHFRYDSKFRMNVLGILPLFIFYVFLAFQQGGIPNPFEVNEPFISVPKMFVYMAYFMFPVMLKTNLVYSESWEASWIFLTTPTHYRKAIAAARHFVMAYFMLPFTALSAVIFFGAIANPILILLHLAILFLLALFNLQAVDLLQPGLPFSQEHRKGAHSSAMFLLMLIAPLFAFLILPLLFYYIYSNLWILCTFLASLIASIVAMEALLDMRLKRFNRPVYSGL